jgi:PAS domain S-box-containing protein
MKLHQKIILIILALLLFQVSLIGTWSYFETQKTLVQALQKDIKYFKNEIKNKILLKQSKFIEDGGQTLQTDQSEDYKDAVLAELQSQVLKSNHHLYIYNHKKNLITKNRKNFLSNYGVSQLADFSNLSLDIGEINDLQRKFYFSSYYFEPWKWTIFIVSDEQSLVSSLFSISKGAVIILLIGGMVSFLFLYTFMKHSFIKPMKQLQIAFKKFYNNEKIENLKVNAGKEFENLSESLQEASNNSLMYLEKLRSTQDALIHSEKRFLDITDAAGEYIWEINPDGKFYFLTKRAEDIYGRTVDFLKGKYIFDFMSQGDREYIHTLLEKSVKNKAAFKDIEIQTIHRNGLPIWQKLTGLPVLNKDGEVNFFRGVGLNISDYKKTFLQLQEREKILKAKIEELNNAHLILEEKTKDLKESSKELKSAKETAEQANVFKSHFLSNMGHEIRTPINGIMGMLELLNQTKTTLEQSKYIKTALSSTSSLFQIINDIIDLSNLQNDKVTLEKTSFNLEEVIEDFMETMSARASEKKLKLNCEIAPYTEINLQGDLNRFRQVLFNLASNAIEYSAQGSVTIIINSQKIKKGAVLLKVTVRDTGIGIDHDTAKILTHQFKQKNGKTKNEYYKIGLGLPICSELVHLMGGDIGINLDYKNGTEFWFSLPFEKSRKEVPKTPHVEETRLAQNKNANILVAEDNQVNQIYIETLLRKKGHKVKIARNGLEAIDCLKEDKFDLILMDIQMPEMDGLEATKKIRKLKSRKAKTPIIALTANAMTDHKIEYLNEGMDEYISKPIDQDELWQKINQFL